MEDTLDVPISSGAAPNEEKSDGSISHEEDCTQGASKEDELESAKAEMSEVRNENARLKMMLQQIEKDYKSLKNRFIDIFEQETKRNINNDHSEESELVSLRLGRSANEFKKDDTIVKENKTREDVENKDGLKLGLERNLGGFKSDRLELRLETSPENSLGETKKEEAGTRWPPSEELKSSIRSGEDEVSEQPSVKRARVSVRARCDTPTMHDGCQWRKYGQKIAKGNPCPRAYYRCTVAPACPVRKQVQRCAEDMSILTTTYEGTHNHPLPISATAMASTTSAAASMLLSGSSTAQTTSQSANLHGLNVNLLSDNSRTRPFYLPNTPTPNFPTITLDLTTSSSSPYNMFSPSFQSTPRFPSQSLNFSSSETNMVPTVWGSGYLGQGTLPYNKTPIGSLSLGRPSQEHFYHPYMEKNNQGSSQQPLTESLTKAITADPSFRSAIEAAISSLVGNGGAAQGNQGGGESFGHHLK